MFHSYGLDRAADDNELPIAPEMTEDIEVCRCQHPNGVTGSSIQGRQTISPIRRLITLSELPNSSSRHLHAMLTDIRDPDYVMRFYVG
mgnify:CR=1 FL=1